MGIPAVWQLCYGSRAHCAVVVVESASLALDSKEDAMLIGLSLIVVAVFVGCALLFRLSIYALPLFVAFLAGSATYRTVSSILAALAAAAIAAIVLLVIAQLALASAKSEFTRAAIGVTFAAPAAVAAYHAVHGIAAATMPTSTLQSIISLLGATIIAAASWKQWGRAHT